MTTGLYQIDEFKDNCGFGLIAHLKGKTSHRLLTTAIEALTCMTHRGGINADGKTGDGCGLLIQKPDSFLRAVAKEVCGAELTSIYGVGSVMLNSNAEIAKTQQSVLNEELTQQGLEVVGWRLVPTDQQCLGPIALKSLPSFHHIFINSPPALTQEQINARLFVARRKTELRLASDKSFYISSLSTSI